MAFSFKSLLKSRKKDVVLSPDGDDDPFLSPGADEIPEREMVKMEEAKAAPKRKAARRKKGIWGGLMGYLPPSRKKEGDKKKADTSLDPFDNPELMALIAAEVADVPIPDPTPSEESHDETSAGPDSVLASTIDEQRLDDERPAAPSASPVDRQGGGDEDGFPGNFPLEGKPEEEKPGFSSLPRGISVAASVLFVLALLGGGWWMVSVLSSTADHDTGRTARVSVPRALPGDHVSMTLPPPPPLPGSLAPSRPSRSAPGEAPDDVAETSVPTGSATRQAKASGKGGVTLAEEESISMMVAALPPLKEPLLPDPDAKRVTPHFDKITKLKDSPGALAPAPADGLAQTTPVGVLPVRAADGRRAWKVYARPFKAAADTPRIALVVVGLGLNPVATAAAIALLPSDVTLSFSPYAPTVAQQMAKARQSGHEVMLDLPMEPTNFPTRDPGPLAMLTMLTENDNVGRLQRVLGKGLGYVGVINHLGARFTQSPEAMRPILQSLSQRGLLYVNTHPQAAGIAANVDVSLPLAEAVITLDQRLFRESVDGRLRYLVDVAKARGRAIGVLSATPLSFDRVIAWVPGLRGKGAMLAPVSATVRSPKS